ncbi:hypothetical protein ACRRTK_001729 [Alexandromys fortis]
MIHYGSCSCLSLEQDFLDAVTPSDTVILLIPMDDMEEGVAQVIEIYEETEDGNEEEELVEVVVVMEEENDEEAEIDVSGIEE